MLCEKTDCFGNRRQKCIVLDGEPYTKKACPFYKAGKRWMWNDAKRAWEDENGKRT